MHKFKLPKEECALNMMEQRTSARDAAGHDAQIKLPEEECALIWGNKVICCVKVSVVWCDECCTMDNFFLA